MVTLADSRSYESVVYYPILMQAFDMSKDIVVNAWTETSECLLDNDQFDSDRH